MSAPKTRARVKVVEFTAEPGLDGGRSGRGDRGDRGARPLGKRSRIGAALASNAGPGGLDRESTWADVQAFGASGQDKRTRKAYEQEQLVKLGCAPAKAAKMPRKMYYSMKKTHAKREEKRRAMEAEADLVTARSGKPMSKTAKERAKRATRKKRNDDVHMWVGGNFHRGILRIQENN